MILIFVRSFDNTFTRDLQNSIADPPKVSRHLILVVVDLRRVSGDSFQVYGEVNHLSVDQNKVPRGVN